MIKLQQKYQRQLAKILAIIAIPFILGLYFVISYFTQDEIKELLHFQSNNIAKAISQNKYVVSIYPVYEVEKLIKSEGQVEVFQKVDIYDEVEKEDEEYYELIVHKMIDGQTYRITTRSTAVEQEDLFLSIFFSTLLLLMVLSTLFYFWNRRILKHIWQPFHKTLARLKSFSSRDINGIQAEQSEIHEFHEFAQVSSVLTSKVISDYKNLKQFTENASHEIQTPLAIIQSKIEELVDSDNLTESQSQNISKIYDASDRLSKLNKGLLLLTKIENQQFENKERIDLGEFIGKETAWIEEHFFEGSKKVNIEESSPFILEINPTLAEILIRNMMINMVSHTEDHLGMNILIDHNCISFSNPGTKSIKNVDQLFDRFYKESNNSNSLGLGLAISKTICEHCKLELSYSYRHQNHIFNIEKVD